MTARPPVALVVVASVALVLAVATLALHRAAPLIFTDVGPLPETSTRAAWLGGSAFTSGLAALAMTMRMERRAVALAVAAGCLVLAVGVFTAASDDRMVRWEYARACVERGQGFWCLDPSDPIWRADAADVPGPLAVGGAAIAIAVQYVEFVATGVLIVAALVRRGRARSAAATRIAPA